MAKEKEKEKEKKPIIYYNQASSRHITKLKQSILIRCQWAKGSFHRHLSNIDCLTAHTACLVCFISTVNGHNKNKRTNAKNVLLVAGI